MVSKNNQWQHLQSSARRVPHYGLRKLSVGVASVLLSTTLYAGLNAQADTVTSGFNGSDTHSQAVSVDSLTGSLAPTDPAAPASIAAPKSTASPAADQDRADSSSVPAFATADGSKITLGPTDAKSTASQVVKPLVLMAQSGSASATVTDPMASVAQGIKDTGVGGTFNKIPQYVAKSASIEFGGTNFTKINNYNVNLSRESSFEFSVKGKFTLDGSQIKKDRQILLGTILFTNNFYTDPNNAVHNQHMLISWGGPITVTSSNGKEIGYAQLSNANGAEADWMLHVTSAETWVGDVNISLNIPLAGYVGYFTDTAVYNNVTTNKPWVETVQTPDNTYKLTYTLHAFTSGWWYYQNSVGRDKGSIYFTKIAPALQTSEKYPSATLQDTLGKAGPADAKLGNYKFVVKVSGLGTPTLVTPGVGFENSFYPVDQNNHVIAEMIGYYGNIDGTSNKLANNLTAQQLYDQVGAHQTLYSVQDDGSMLIATEITPDDIYLSDERIIQELQHGSMLYATASSEDQQKIIKNTLAFYHGVLKNTPLITRTYFRIDDGNGFRNAIIDSGVQDVTPLSSGRAPVSDTRYYKVGAPSASASGDLLQYNYVYYVDGAEGNKVIHTTDLAGKAGDVKIITVTIPTGYVLDQARTGSTPASYVLKDGNNTPIYIYLKHTTVQVTPGQPKTTSDKLPDNPTKSYPAGVGQSDLNRTITRTIQVVDPHTRKVTTTTQTVHLTRTATVDEVSGTVTYGKWTTGEWQTFNVPAVAGYTPRQANVAKTMVTDTTKDQTVKITYVANPQSTTVNYVDGTGKVIHTTLLKGVTDQTVTVSSEVPAGWKLVDGQTVPSEITFGANGHAPVTVKVEHQVTTSQEQRTITRNIKLTTIIGDSLADTKSTTVKQTATIMRDVKIDQVTHKTVYGNWSSAQWDAYQVPNEYGYQANRGLIPAVTVTDQTEDQQLEIQKITLTRNVKFLAAAANLLDPVSVMRSYVRLIDRSGDTPIFNRWAYVPHSIVVEHHPADPKTYFEISPSVISHDELNKVTIEPSDTPNEYSYWNDTIFTTTVGSIMQIIDGDTEIFAAAPGVGVSDNLPNGELEPMVGEDGVVQYDLITNRYEDVFSNRLITIHYADGSHEDQTVNQLLSYIYHTRESMEQAKLLSADYTPLGDNNQVYPAYHVTVPAGYEADQTDVPSEAVTFDQNNYGRPNDGTPVVITLTHKYVTVTADQPHVDGTLLPDNSAKTFTGVSATDLNKTVTRTINLHNPYPGVKTTKQTLKLTRTATVDEVTGEVKYSDWTTGQWDAYEIPSVNGYTASQAGVVVTPVDGHTVDQTVEVNYTPNKQSTTVKYVDGGGQVIHTTTVDGVTDQTVTVPNEVPANWQLVSGQTVPSQLTFGPDGHPAVTVKIEHQVKTVQEQKTITRTINYVDAQGTRLKPSTVQQLTFTRTGVQDLVTKAITWNSTPNQSFAAVNDLDILGYKSDITTIPVATVNWDDQDLTVNVHYQVANSTVTVNLVDVLGHVISTTPVTGQVGSTVDLAVQVPDGWVAYNKDMPTRVVIGIRPTEFDYLIGHRLAFVKVTDGVKAGDPIPGTKTKTFNDKVNVNNLITHAAYTVNVWADEAHTRKLATKTYHTDFTRDALVDAVTGDVYYYNWSGGGKHTFAGFTRQAGDGYQAVVTPAWLATQANPNKTLDLVAQPQQAAGTIRYQTMDGSMVFSQDFAGNKAVTLTAPKGYTLMTNVAAITPALGQGQIYMVYVRPTATLYTAADQLPTGVENLRKIVTRTIRITEANGHVRTITQRVRFTRTATVKADGSIVYSAWRATGRAVWNKVFLPKRHGYHLVIDNKLVKMNVTGDMRDAMVNVKYVKD